MTKVFGCTVVQNSEDNSVRIHVHGDMLPNSTFLEILDLLKENKDKKPVDFTADFSEMMLLITQSIPREHYRKLELKRYDDQVQTYQDAV